MCSDLSHIFPANTVEGVSSAIVLSSNITYEAFEQVNYAGMQMDLEPKSWTPKFTGYDNDRIQSIRRR